MDKFYDNIATYFAYRKSK